MKRAIVLLLAVCLVAFPLCYILTLAPKPVPTEPTVNIIIRAGPKDGSLLFWKDGLLVNPILKHTGSHLTHAAIILNGYVYEAVPPRVHKVSLAEYIKEMEAKKLEPAMQKRGFTYLIIQPKTPFTTSEQALMLKYADSQLGRPYMLRGWWKGHEVRGIFCSQLVSDILAKGGRIKSDSIHESPGSLYGKIKDTYQ